MIKKLVAQYLRDKLSTKSIVSQSFIEESIHSQIVDRLPSHYPSWEVAKVAGELYSLLVDIGMVEQLVMSHMLKRLFPSDNIKQTVFYTETYNLVVDILPPGCLSEDVAEAASKLYGCLLYAHIESRKIVRRKQNAIYNANKN